MTRGQQINRLIYLTGSRASGGYTVVTSAFDGCLDIAAPNVGIGNAIVRALRDHAAQLLGRGLAMEDIFPPSAVRRVGGRI